MISGGSKKVILERDVARGTCTAKVETRTLRDRHAKLLGLDGLASDGGKQQGWRVRPGSRMEPRCLIRG